SRFVSAVWRNATRPQQKTGLACASDSLLGFLVELRHRPLRTRHAPWRRKLQAALAGQTEAGGRVRTLARHADQRVVLHPAQILAVEAVQQQRLERAPDLVAGRRSGKVGCLERIAREVEGLEMI